MNKEDMKAIFTTSDEPYLGRELLYHYDQMILCCLEVNSKVAPLSHKLDLSSAQKMACKVIPQSISLALSIRELIRQGYLFGAHVLKRSLIERVMILLYINNFPDKISLWDEGWGHRSAPSLAKMFECINNKEKSGLDFKGHELTAPLNSLVHGKPDSSDWNCIIMDDGKFGNASSKMLNSPSLCDDLCVDILPWLTVITAMMRAYFPEENV